MSTSTSLRPVFLMALLVGAILLGLVSLVAPAAAEPNRGATSGPWRCQSFDMERTMQGTIADWLYQHASTGPDNVLVLSGADSNRGYVTLCAWDSGFAAAHWLAQEEERRRHEEEVQARKEKLQRGRTAGDTSLFPEDIVEFEESDEKKQGRKKR
ncbi:MAG TPA: hypothetical protein DIU15_12190 [Deltaproteobacteria bacterium]|nr:hypothetical protein [Deltaproteobacteria bacterium]HCP46796.1 hypothetical protein [Deltaproteobacteria bacterium]